jgi:hypothetical protein
MRCRNESPSVDSYNEHGRVNDVQPVSGRLEWDRRAGQSAAGRCYGVWKGRSLKTIWLGSTVTEVLVA